MCIRKSVSALCFFYIISFRLFADNSIDSLLSVLNSLAGETPQKADILNALAWKYKGINVDKSIEYSERAKSISEKINYTSGIITALRYEGIAYRNKRKLAKALELFMMSLKFSEKLADTNAIAASNTMIGTVYHALGDDLLAINYNQKAIELYLAINKADGLCASYNNIGNSFKKMKKYNEALENFSHSLDYAQSLTDTSRIIEVINNIGTVHIEQNNLDEAFKQYSRAIRLSQDNPNRRDIYCTALLNLGIVYGKSKQFNNAVKHLNDALLIAAEIGYTGIVQEGFISLSDNYEKSGDYEKALSYFKKYTQMKDSVFTEKTSNDIAEMQTKYETEKKDIEIAVKQVLIDKRNQQIIGVMVISLLLILIAGLFLLQNKLRVIRKESEFKQQLLRLQMNPHFLFNSLGAIQNYLFNHRPDDAAVYLAKFADLMRHILESSQGEFVLMEREVETLKNYLQLQQLRFDYSFDFSIITDPSVDVRFLCIPPMLAQPFIENAIQHGLSKKTSNGHIRISYKIVSENSMTVEIKDNGTGISKEKQLGKKHKSMAIDITRERLGFLNKRKLKKIHFEIIDLAKTTPDAQSGTKVIFETPYKIIDELIS